MMTRNTIFLNRGLPTLIARGICLITHLCHLTAIKPLAPHLLTHFFAAVPLINISQPGGQVQLGTPINVSSVLKPSDKVPTSFAQLVQTSTGKHLLLTSNPNITGSVPVSQATAGIYFSILVFQLLFKLVIYAKLCLELF